MGLYSHLSDAELRSKRDALLASMEEAASGVASVSTGGRSVSYHQSLHELRRLFNAADEELALRSGRPARRAIYLV